MSGKDGKRKATGRAAEGVLRVLDVVTLAGYGAVIVVLAGWDRLRYGPHQCETEVYPGVLPVRLPGDFASLDENRST
jgi:hypothetical protein